MPTEKILLPIFLAIVAGLITAIMAIVKLVNDKESKTTDYRQAWTQSVRTSLADLISNIHLLANGMVKRLELQATHQPALQKSEEPEAVNLPMGFFSGMGSIVGLGNRWNKAARRSETASKADDMSLKYSTDRLAAEDAYIREQWRNLHKSYALARLHFRVDDKDFGEIEQAFVAVLGQLNALDKLDARSTKSEREPIRIEIQTSAEQLTKSAREMLKKEWERIKKGETTFQATKRYAFVFTVAAGLVIVCLTIVIAANSMKDSARPADAAASQADVKAPAGSKASSGP